MALSVVAEEAEDFREFEGAHEALDFIRQPIASQYRTSQDARGAASHAPLSASRGNASPRPATAFFPTKEVIAVLGAIGAVLGARLALLVSLGMMFALGFAAPNEESARWRIGLFGLFGVIPVVWLSSRRSI